MLDLSEIPRRRGGSARPRVTAAVAALAAVAGGAVAAAALPAAAMPAAALPAAMARVPMLAPVVVATVAHAMADTAATVSRGLDSAAVADEALPPDDVDGLYGLSGKLRARFVAPARSLQVPVLARLFGDSALRTPGVHALAAAAADRPLNVITLVPFEEKVRGRLGSYRMGFWPHERGTARAEAYDNPPGFIRVTRENQDTQVSEHFRLRDFLTKDQAVVWPKYLVLREELLDKLELVIADLESRGTPVRHVSVMSGFRTPQYNQQGVGAGGRAQNSRHQYGDAADVFVDNDRDGRLDDLNGDGRVDMRDVRVMLDAVERVERSHPTLVGGAGMYRATSAHGPFVHVDVRGNRARWGVS